MLTVHKFALPSFVQLVRLVSPPCKSQITKIQRRDSGPGAIARAFAPHAFASVLGLQIQLSLVGFSLLRMLVESGPVGFCQLVASATVRG